MNITMNIKMSRFILGVYGVALASLVTQAHAQITFNSPAFITTSQLTSPSIYPGNASPIGLTYAGNKFVGTGGYPSSNLLYQTDLSGLNISPFGAVPSASGEVVLAASPNSSGYGSNAIFAGSGANGQIYQFANTGGAASLFATVGSGQVRGISFDPTGLYGNNMIVTTTTGAVYEVGTAGQVFQLANLGADTEGIGFATQKFGTYAAGTLFTTSENSQWINAISPTGTVTPVFQIPAAESISFVPANIASETNPVEGFYGVNYPNNVLFAPAAQFDQYAGDVIVTSETSGGKNISAISLDSGNIATITGIGSMNQPEDSIFVTQQTVDTHGPGVPDGGSTAAMLLAGMLTLGALAYRRKSALSI
jgi:hypothetical protein